MISSLFQGLLKFVLKLFQLIMSPFISVIVALFPQVDTFFSYISQFLDKALTYVSVIIDIFLIPRGAISLLFDYFIIIYTIFITAQAIKFFVNIYNKFKL